VSGFYSSERVSDPANSSAAFLSLPYSLNKVQLSSCLYAHTQLDLIITRSLTLLNSASPARRALLLAQLPPFSRAVQQPWQLLLSQLLVLWHHPQQQHPYVPYDFLSLITNLLLLQPAAAASSGPGMLGQMAATAGSVAIGSTIGHGLSNMLFGSSSPSGGHAEPVQSQQQPLGSQCDFQVKGAYLSVSSFCFGTRQSRAYDYRPTSRGTRDVAYPRPNFLGGGHGRRLRVPFSASRHPFA